MGSVLIETQAGPFQKGRSVNHTATSFTSKIPTGTEPAADVGTATGSAAIPVGQNAGGTMQNIVLVSPYGTGGDNDTFSMRVIGWRVVGQEPQTWIWIPVLLAELACTLCAAVGVAGRNVVATERFVDTITLVAGNDDVSVDITSPTGDVIAHAMIDIKGFQKIEFTYDATAAGTTGMNTLYALL